MAACIFILELIGTVAFAVSGAMTALKKNMDIFGVAILGLTTAVGGGAIRDVLLGVTPPATFREPVYAIVAIGTSIFVFIPSVRHLLTKNLVLYERVMLIMDSLGLGIFTVVGISAAYGISEDFNLFLLLFVGIVTGAGGGVRAMFWLETRLIFLSSTYTPAHRGSARFSARFAGNRLVQPPLCCWVQPPSLRCAFWPHISAGACRARPAYGLFGFSAKHTQLRFCQVTFTTAFPKISGRIS